jgi:hypothetical protein
MEQHMAEPTVASGEGPPPGTDEDQAIRQQVRALTGQVLQQGRIDPEAIREVVRSVTGQKTSQTPAGKTEAREMFAGTVRDLDQALLDAANAAHDALQQLSSRGQDFTTNDLKEALVCLRRLEEAYVAAAQHIAEAMSGNLRREMTELAGHAQEVGTEARARIAGLMSEFASRMGEGATSGLETMRGTSIRMALLASGVLAGVADALRDLSEAKKAK